LRIATEAGLSGLFVVGAITPFRQLDARLPAVRQRALMVNLRHAFPVDHPRPLRSPRQLRLDMHVIAESFSTVSRERKESVLDAEGPYIYSAAAPGITARE
jgi:hypothetical protein